MLAPAVLLVDDDMSTIEIVAHYLSGKEYRILQANDAAEALAASETYKGLIPLLLTDIAMPGMNGMELAKRIRHHRPETRVLFITAYRDQFDLLGCDVLDKPFTSEELLDRIRRVLKLSGEGSRAA